MVAATAAADITLLWSHLHASISRVLSDKRQRYYYDMLNYSDIGSTGFVALA